MKFIDSFKQELQARRTYYQTSRSEIAHTNLKLLRITSVASAILFIILVIITPYIIKQWHITIGYWALFGFFIAIHIFTVWYSKQSSENPFFISALCIIFCLVLLLNLGYVGIFPFPNEHDFYISFAYMIIPVLFIIPMYISGALLILFEIAYCIIIMKVKPYDIALDDIFRTIIALFFSSILSQVVCSLRAQDNISRIRFEHLSKTDKLTGILNKMSFEENCKEYLLTKSQTENCTLFIIDMDNFKAVNDTLGHRAGDELLEGIGEALRSIFRATDIIGRIGGDEFSVLMKSIVDTNLIMKRTEIIEERAAAILKTADLNISCSIGAAICLGTNVPFETLFKQADSALYAAKEQGKARCNIAF